MKRKNRKILSTLAKIGVSILLLWLVYSKISFFTIWKTIQKIDFLYFTVAIFFYILSQIVSSQRLLKYFYNLSFFISVKSNFLLYLIGMFYNFFIPGGIGGDAYKVYLLNQQFRWKAKQLGAAVLADRVSGLIAICCWITLLSLGVEYTKTEIGVFIPVVILLFGIYLSKQITNKLFPSFQNIFYSSLLYSLIIQGLQLVSVYFILKSLHQNNYFTEYFILFLTSSILSVFSFSGIGIREFVFLRFAIWFSVDAEIAVSVGFIFTIITFIIALPGLFPILFTSKKMTLKNEIP